jgi:hypothetical protein
VHIPDSAMCPLVLYVVINKVDQPGCVLQKKLARRHVTAAKNYVGLRETEADAVQRREKSWTEKVTCETHVLLKLTFTEVGLGRLTRQICPGVDFFTSRMYKKTFTDPTTDWKIWHYVGDLPLQGDDADDETNFTAEWLPVSVV